VYAVNGKIFFLPDILFLGGVLGLDKYTLPWQMCFICGVILDKSHLAFR